MAYISITREIDVDIDIDLEDYIEDIAHAISRDSGFKDRLLENISEQDGNTFNVDNETVDKLSWDIIDFRMRGEHPTLEYLEELYSKLIGK